MNGNDRPSEGDLDSVADRLSGSRHDFAALLSASPTPPGVDCTSPHSDPPIDLVGSLARLERDSVREMLALLFETAGEGWGGEIFLKI